MEKSAESAVTSYLSTLPIPSLDLQIFLQISSEYPKILILGGLGFLGKNFYEFIVSNSTFTSILVVDKSLPEISHVPAFKLPLYTKNPKTKFIQIDLCSEKHLRKVFMDNQDIDVVVNFAAETRLSLSEEDYENRCYKLPIICGRLAAEFKIKKFIQISCCKVYKSASGGKIKENSDTDPWDIRYANLLEAEKVLRKIPRLNLVILRVAGVYGPYDFTGEMALRLTGSRVYKELGEKMKIMWDGSLKSATVNVLDVARAILYAISRCSSGELYNIVDENDTDQNKINAILKGLFHITIECVGNVRSYMMKIALDRVIQMLNEKHLQVWFELGTKHNTLNSPMNVVVYRENLTNNNLFIDGEAFKQRTGFSYLIPRLDLNYFKALVQDYEKFGFLPP